MTELEIKKLGEPIKGAVTTLFDLSDDALRRIVGWLGHYDVCSGAIVSHRMRAICQEVRPTLAQGRPVLLVMSRAQININKVRLSQSLAPVEVSQDDDGHG
jgi:hypothetical protein